MTRVHFLAAAAASALRVSAGQRGQSHWVEVGDRYCVEEGVTAPRVTRRVAPEYTDEARTERLEGVVVVSCQITPEGRPDQIRILVPLGLGLDERAVEAVRQWTFSPAVKFGKPAPATARLEIRFLLEAR